MVKVSTRGQSMANGAQDGARRGQKWALGIKVGQWKSKNYFEF